MPNVDSCVRFAEKGLCGDTAMFAESISLLNEENKVKIFKDKTKKEIETILLKCSNTIKAYINNNYYDGKNNNIILVPENNNNKIGADLKHILLDSKIIGIEVKFGEQTDKNIGMEKFNKIFSCDIFSKILSIDNRKKWIDLFFNKENEDEKKQLERLFYNLNTSIDHFNKFNQGKNWTLTKEEQNYMESEIINVSGDGSVKYDYYLKFLLNGDNFSLFIHIPTKIGKWIIQKVDYLIDEVKRVNIFVDNFDTNVRIKYTLNWKNDYKYNNKKAKAKLGLGSPNWNIWVDTETKKNCYFF